MMAVMFEPDRLVLSAQGAALGFGFPIIRVIDPVRGVHLCPTTPPQTALTGPLHLFPRSLTILAILSSLDAVVWVNASIGGKFLVSN